jgi:hypothetical protein
LRIEAVGLLNVHSATRAFEFRPAQGASRHAWLVVSKWDLRDKIYELGHGAESPRKKQTMASKKNVPVAMTEPSQSTADHPEYATELPERAAEPETAGSELTNDREEQIRQAAYAAFERRNGQEGSPEQDWLDAEAQWDRDRSR